MSSRRLIANYHPHHYPRQWAPSILGPCLIGRSLATTAWHCTFSKVSNENDDANKILRDFVDPNPSIFSSSSSSSRSLASALTKLVKITMQAQKRGPAGKVLNNIEELQLDTRLLRLLDCLALEAASGETKNRNDMLSPFHKLQILHALSYFRIKHVSLTTTVTEITPEMLEQYSIVQAVNFVYFSAYLGHQLDENVISCVLHHINKIGQQYGLRSSRIAQMLWSLGCFPGIFRLPDCRNFIAEAFRHNSKTNFQHCSTYDMNQLFQALLSWEEDTQTKAEDGMVTSPLLSPKDKEYLRNTFRDYGSQSIVVSSFQKQVYHVLKKSQIPFEREYVSKIGYSLDAVLEKAPGVALEMQGPKHFLLEWDMDISCQHSKSRQKHVATNVNGLIDPREAPYVYCGRTRLKHRHLTYARWELLHIPFPHWMELKTLEEKQMYLGQLLPSTK